MEADTCAVSLPTIIFHQGVIKWYSIQKGFGFIAPDAPWKGHPNPDVFMHITQLDQAMQYMIMSGQCSLTGMHVQYSVHRDPSTGRVQAWYVRPMGEMMCYYVGYPSTTMSWGSPVAVAPSSVSSIGTGSPHSFNSLEHARRSGGVRRTTLLPGPKPTQVFRRGNRRMSWTTRLNSGLQENLTTRGIIRRLKGEVNTVDFWIPSGAVKLGGSGYCMAVGVDNKGIVEGSFECSNIGQVSMRWERGLRLVGEGQWVSCDPLNIIESTVDLSKENDVVPITGVQDLKSLLGRGGSYEEMAEVKRSLENNGFKIKRVIFGLDSKLLRRTGARRVQWG